MSVEMAIWRMTAQGPLRLEFASLQAERRLEDMVVADPALAGLDVLVVGRQVTTTFGGIVDVLGLDDEARIHVVELKRDRTGCDSLKWPRCDGADSSERRNT